MFPYSVQNQVSSQVPVNQSVQDSARFHIPYREGSGSGLSPPETNSQSPVHFGGVGLPAAGLQVLTANAVSQMTLDAMGVWAPKMLVGRSLIQRVEDTILEWGENALFYMTVPIMGQKFLGPLVSKLQQVPLGDLGTNYNTLVDNKLPVSRKLLGAKFGAVAGALFVAAGLEYVISFAKNLVTVKVFNAKNFTAVAGLEEAQGNGKYDTEKKAWRRIKQASLIGSGLLLGSFALPGLVRRSKVIESLAEKALKYLDFGGGLKEEGTRIVRNKLGEPIAENLADLTKPLLLLTAGTGAVSYLDACRDKLEFKETATRLSFVIPYMIAGKELTGNLFAKLIDGFSSIKAGNKFLKVGEVAPLLNIKTLGGTIKNGFHHKNFLNFNAVQGEEDYLKRANQLAKQYKFAQADAAKRLDAAWAKSKFVPTGLRNAQPSSWPFLGEFAKVIAAKNPFERRYYTIGVGKYLLSAVGVGVIINLLAYAQTRYRFEQSRQEAWENLELTSKQFKPFQQALSQQTKEVSEKGMVHWMLNFAGQQSKVSAA